MLDITVSGGTSAPPEQVLATAIDLSEARVTVWPNSKPRYFELHAQGEGFAEVTEGFRPPFWPRLGTKPLRVAARIDSPNRDRLQCAGARQYMGARGVSARWG